MPTSDAGSASGGLFERLRRAGERIQAEHGRETARVVLKEYLAPNLRLSKGVALGLAGDILAGDEASFQRVAGHVGLGASAARGGDANPSPGLQVLSKSSHGGVIVHGPASVEIVDEENDRVSGPALAKALPQLLRRGRVSFQHLDILVGDILEKFVDDDGTEYATHVRPVTKADMERFPWLEKQGVSVGDEALFLTAKLYEDNDFSRDIRDQVLKGELNCFSISGQTTEKTQRLDCDGFSCKLVNDVSKVDLSAVTLCKRGMNSAARFVVLQKGARGAIDSFLQKSDSGGTVSDIDALVKQADGLMAEMLERDAAREARALLAKVGDESFTGTVTGGRPSTGEEMGLPIGYPQYPQGPTVDVAPSPSHDTEDPGSPEDHEYPAGSDRTLGSANKDEAPGQHPAPWFQRSRALEKRAEALLKQEWVYDGQTDSGRHRWRRGDDVQYTDTQNPPGQRSMDDEESMEAAQSVASQVKGGGWPDADLQVLVDDYERNPPETEAEEIIYEAARERLGLEDEADADPEVDEFAEPGPGAFPSEEHFFEATDGLAGDLQSENPYGFTGRHIDHIVRRYQDENPDYRDDDSYNALYDSLQEWAESSDDFYESPSEYVGAVHQGVLDDGRVTLPDAPGPGASEEEVEAYGMAVDDAFESAFTEAGMGETDARVAATDVASSYLDDAYDEMEKTGDDGEEAEEALDGEEILAKAAPIEACRKSADDQDSDHACVLSAQGHVQDELLHKACFARGFHEHYDANCPTCWDVAKQYQDPAEFFARVGESVFKGHTRPYMPHPVDTQLLVKELPVIQAFIRNGDGHGDANVTMVPGTA